MLGNVSASGCLRWFGVLGVLAFGLGCGSDGDDSPDSRAESGSGGSSAATGASGAGASGAGASGGGAGGAGTKASAGSGTAGSGTAGGRAAGGGGTGGKAGASGNASECVVALRLDRCCAQYEPMRRSELAANECLAEYAAAVSRSLAQRCFERSPDDCTLVDCAVMTAPQSRIALANAAGMCSFGDECNRPEDCALGRDTTRCCTCLESVPVAVLERNACIAGVGATPPDDCPVCTDPVQCGGCPETPAPTCLIRDSFSLCR